jgi:hypothetical protein
MRTFLSSFALGILILAAHSEGRAELIFGLTTQNSLITLDSATPGSASAALPITGAGATPVIVGIDFRPIDGALVAVGQQSGGIDAGFVYGVNPLTGAAVVLSSSVSGFPIGAVGNAFGVDFNPVANALRIVDDFGANTRITSGGAGVINFDASLNPFVPPPNIVAAAYSNNIPDGIGGQTTLYVIDSDTDRLLTQGSINGTPVSPNTGTLFDVGALGVNTSDLAGFDISGATGIAYASLTAPGAGASQLYSINLGTGQATLIGTIGGGLPLRGLSVQPAAIPEPGTLAIFAGGLACIAGYGWRRRRQIA